MLWSLLFLVFCSKLEMYEIKKVFKINNIICQQVINNNNIMYVRYLENQSFVFLASLLTKKLTD